MRILYVHASYVPPPPPPERHKDRFFLLSSGLEGDVLQPVWFETPEEVEKSHGPGSYPVYTAGRFRYHWFLATKDGRFKPRWAVFAFYLRKGFQLCRENRYDCIVVYSHMTTALVAGVLKLFAGVPLVPEIATSPKLSFLNDRPRPTWGDKLRRLYSDLSLHISMWISRRAHFLYPTQLAGYPLLRHMPNSVFHEFIAVSMIDRSQRPASADPYIILVGAPWYLKGADVLIDAFLRLAPDYPSLRLKIVGHLYDRAGLEAMAKSSPGIDIIKGTPNDETLRMIGQAEVLVLPSRSEGMGRVLIEAMASGVPMIGSDAGGIPYMIQHGETGFVVPVGDSRALEARLRQLLSDPELRRRMGDAGYRHAHEHLTEAVYVEQFTGMIQAAVQGGQ